MRYRAVMELYNRVNESIAFYAALTGDTTVVPMVAKEPDNAPYTSVVSEMYKDQKEYEMTTPYYYDTALKKQAEASGQKKSVTVTTAAVTEQMDNARVQKANTNDTQAVRSARVHPAEGSRKIDLNALMNSENPRRRKVRPDEE